MRTWKKIVLGILVTIGLVVGGTLLVASMQPDTYRISRSHVIPAQPAQIHPLLDDFTKWPSWSPWEGLDPNMTRERSEPPRGTGAWYRWKGNDDVGSGKMTITGSAPTRVDIRLEFIEPFESIAQTRFDLVPQGAGTQVTWTMDGNNNLMGKVFSLFMDMDKMVGADFEKGLRKMERAATQ